MVRSISHCYETDTARANTKGSGFVFRLVLWGTCLGLVLGGSVYLRAPGSIPGSAARLAFPTAITAAYLIVFAHCLTRLVYSRLPSWILYTIGFGGLSCSGALRMISATSLLPSQLQREWFEMLGWALLPASTAMLVFAAQASAIRAREHKPKPWKVIARVFLFAAAIGVLWRTGGIEFAVNIIRSTGIEPRLVVDISSVTALGVLLCGAGRSAVLKRDEIVLPAYFWSVAMLISAVLTLVAWQQPQALWFQVSGMELAGAVALVVGLTLENERAHREAAQQMADLKAMQRISWSLVGAANITELCSVLASAVAEGFRAVPVIVYLVGDNSDELVIMATSGVDDGSLPVGKVCSLKPERRPGFHNGHTARAFVSGEVQIVREIFSDVESLPWRVVARYEGVVISVPLPYQNRVIGALNIFLADATRVDEGRTKLLEAIAAAVSPAIENARLRSTPDALRIAA